MIVRLLTVLAITLPLAACAAQPVADMPVTDVPVADVPVAGGNARTEPASVPAAGVAPAVPAAAAEQPAPAASAQTAPAMRTQPRTASAAQPATRAPAHANDRVVASDTPSAAAPATSSAGTAATPAPVPAPQAAQPAPAAPSAVPAPAAPAPGVTMPAGSPTGSLLQTLFALVLVLAVLGALAWFLKRYGPRAGGSTANLRVVGSLSLGGRERLLVVEVGNQWIVVGASPGRVNALATMPKQEGPAAGEGAALAPHVPAANSFADWLRQTIDKRK